MQHDEGAAPAVAMVTLFLTVLVSGCTGSPYQDSSCVDVHCFTQVDTADASMLEREYEIQTLAINSDGTGMIAPRMADGAVYWQVSRRTGEGGLASDILGVELDGGRALAVSVGLDTHSTRQEGHGDRVVFAQEMVGKRVQVALWDRATEVERALPLDTGEFLVLPVAFDGQWVLLHGSLPGFNGTHRFAYNVADGRLLDLYKQVPKATHENGTFERLMSETVVDGRAYLAVLYGVDLEGTPPAPTREYTDIYEYDLENETRTLLMRRSDVAVTWIDSGSRYLTWAEGRGSNLQVYVMDRATDELQGPFHGPGSENANPRTEGDWVVFTSKGGNFLPPVIALHVPSGNMHDILPMDSGINVVAAHTDGRYFFFQGAPYDNQIDLGPAYVYFFYGMLPTVEPKLAMATA